MRIEGPAKMKTGKAEVMVASGKLLWLQHDGNLWRTATN